MRNLKIPMKRIGVSLVALLLAALPTVAAAQNGPPPGARPGGPDGPQQAGGIIRGTIQDASGKPLPQARIAVWSAADSTLVTGGVARPDGSFQIEGVRPGRYYLRISLIGYTTGTVRDVAIAPATPRADVGAVQLATSAVQLDALEVTTERSAVTTAVDRTVYSTRDLPAASGGNAGDVLRNVPQLEVDADGKLTLRGQENIVVQINGRPAPLSGDALTNFLRQLPAGVIDRVEVIPNPSAKFDPDGMGGIVNIVLKANTDLGLSGGVTVGAATGDKYNASGNLGYQRGPLTLFGSYGLNLDQRTNTGSHWRENHRGDEPQNFFRQISDGENTFNSHLFNGTAEYRLSEKDVLSTSAMMTLRDGDVGFGHTYTFLDANQDETERFAERNRVGLDFFSTDLALSYKRTMEPQKHELSGEVRWNDNHDEMSNRFSRFPTLDDTGTPTRLFTTNQDSRNGTWTGQLDYTRSFGSTKLETGYKGTLREVENDYATLLEENGEPTPDGGDNSFVFDERVHAVYGLITQDFGKLDVQAGLRAERAETTFDLTTTDESFDNDYSSLFPSAAVTFQMDDSRQLRASYSKRIQRPDTRLLNPFPFSEDPFNRFLGNPFLKPEYTHSFELGYQHSLPFGSLNVTPYYRRTEDAVRRVRSVGEDNVATTTFLNLATAEQLGADVTGQLRLGEKLSGFVALSGYQTKSEGGEGAENVGVDAFGWNARASLTYKVNPRLDVQLFQMYRAPLEVEQGRISAFNITNLSVRQKLLGDKASLTVRLNDPFNTMRFQLESEDADHFQTTRRRFDSRGLFVSFNYTFGQAPRIRPRPQQQQPAEDPTGGVGGPPGR